MSPRHTYVDGPEGGRMTPCQRTVLEAIKAHPGWPVRRIAAMVNTSPGMVSKVRQLYLQGARRTDGPKLERVRCLALGPDHWFLTADKKNVHFCPRHRHYTQMDAPITYSVTTRGA